MCKEEDSERETITNMFPEESNTELNSGLSQLNLIMPHAYVKKKRTQLYIDIYMNVDQMILDGLL